MQFCTRIQTDYLHSEQKDVKPLKFYIGDVFM